MIRSHPRRRPATRFSIVLLASVACASGGAPASNPEPLLPADLGTLEARMPMRAGVFDQFAHQAIRGSGTDVIYRYRDGSKTILSVILYPMKGEGESVGSETDRVRQEGSLFAQVLAYQASRGMLQSARVMSQRMDPVAAGSTWIPTHVTVATTTRAGETAYEFQYLHAIRGNFVKVRATVSESAWPRSDLAAFDSSVVVSLAAR